MPDYHRLVREVSWHDLFPWLLLLRTCRLAAEFRRLLLAALGLLLTGLGWGAISAALVSPEERMASSSWQALPAESLVVAGSSYIPWRETAESLISHWRFATQPVRQLVSRPWGWGKFAAASLSTVWAVAIWGLFGGIICRLSAVQLGLDEQLTTASATRFVFRKWPSYLAAPLMPLGVAALLTAPLTVAGLLSRADLGLLLAGLVWPLAIVCGVLVMLLLVGLTLGFPLMWAAISTDDSDSFDAISRAYTYVGQRPLNYLFYAGVALAAGTVGWMIINTLAAMAIYLTSWGAAIGSGEERWQQVERAPGWQIGAADLRIPLTGAPLSMPPFATLTEEPGRIAGVGISFIAFWTGCVRLLAMAYAYSFFWTAGTGAYLLLRRDADAVELDEVLVEGQDDPASLPPITQDAAGVNVLAENPTPAKD